MRTIGVSAGAAIAAAVFGAACTGQIETPATIDGPVGSGDRGGPTGGEREGDFTSEACLAEPGFVPLHRLNKREYNAAIRELFGVSGDYGSRLPSDNKATRYDNNSIVQQISGAHIEGYLAASEDVMADVLAARSFADSCPGPADDTCAAAVLESAATLAFRRDVQPTETEELLEPYRETLRYGLGFDEAVAASLRAVLVSPDFLFRTLGADGDLADVDAELGTVVNLTGVEYATRLAGFIWGSVPDAQLLDEARSGWFDDRDTPETQSRIRQVVERMLQDERSSALVDVFFSTFFHLDMMTASYRRPDPNQFPVWEPELEAAMIAETRTFIAQVIESDTSPLDLLTADYSFINRALAETIYGIDGSGLDDALQRVELPDERRGILTQGTILTMTSNPDRTSIVNRGLWVMDNLMCLPTPSDAPPDAPTETPEIEGASIRERLEAHRSDPSCAVCHSTMDPLGFGLENFDAIGRHRDADDDGFPVDARGELPDGRAFSGATELVDMIARSGDFERCLTRHLLEYAVGRRVGAADECTLDRIDAALTETSPISEWVLQVVLSAPFSQQQVSEDAR